MRAVQAAAFSEKRLYPGAHIRKRLSRQVQESNNATTSSVVQTQSTTDLNNQTSSSITASTSVLISTSTSTGSNSTTALTVSLATSSTASSTASLTTAVSSTSTSTTTSSSTSSSTTETTSTTTTTTASDLEPTADISRKGTFRPAAGVAPAPSVSSITTTAQTTSASTQSQTTNQNPGNQDQSQQTQNSPAAQNGASNQDQSDTQPQNNKGNAGGDNQTGNGSQQGNGNSGNDGQQGSGNSGNDASDTTSASSTSSDLPVATAVSSNVDAAQAGGNGSGNSQQDGGNGSGSQSQQQGNAGGNGSSSASSTSSATTTIAASSTLDGGNFAATSTLVSSGAPSSTNTSEAGSATLSTSKAQIAGVTVGALALVALVSAVLFFVVRRWRNNRGKVFDPESRSPSPKRLTTNTIHSFLGSAPVTARLTVPATYNAPPQIMTEFDGRPLSFGPSTTASLNGAGVGAGMAIGSPSQMRQPAQLPRHDSLTIPGHSGNPYSPSPSPVRSPASPASTIEPQFDFVTPPPMYIQTVTAKNYPAPSQSPTRSFNSQTIDFGYTSGPGNSGQPRYSSGSDQVVISPEQHDPFRDQDPFVDPQVRSQPGGLWLQRSLQ